MSDPYDENTPKPAVSRSFAYALIILIAFLASAIAGLVTALVHAPPMEILTASSTIFGAIFAMGVTTYYFLTHRK